MKKIILALSFIALAITRLAAQPTITAHTPLKNALNIAKNTNITITFSEAMNPASFTNTTIKVNGSQSGLHTGAITYDGGTNTATVNPDADFRTGEVVSITLTVNIKNASGTTMNSPCTWCFTIGTLISLGTFDPKVDYGVGSMPSSIYAANIYKSGNVDLITGNFGSNNASILENDGAGIFAAPSALGTGNSPYSVCVADIDADGDLDLITANYGSSTLSVFKNQGLGIFSLPDSPPTGLQPCSICAVDLDGDGDLDLAVANYSSNNVSILTNNGTGTFTSSGLLTVGTQPSSVYSADLNNDGYMDLAVANKGSDNISVLMNNGNGTFLSMDYTVGTEPSSVCASDFNGDGAVDLAVVNRSSNNLLVFLNNGVGTFAVLPADYGTANFPVAVFAADLNGDGDMDLCVANYNSFSISIFQNSNGTFVDRADYTSGFNPFSVYAADLDGDDDVDLAVANAGSSSLSVFKNKDTPLPVKLVSFTGSAKGQGVALAWSTASEEHNAYFEVLRSVNGQEFTAVGTVPGHNTTNTLQNYYYTDNNPLPSTSYYRLRQVDADGASSYSAIIAVKPNLKETTMQVNQIPDKQLVEITVYAVKGGKGTIRVYDVSGHQLATQDCVLEAGYNTLRIPLQQKGLCIAVLNIVNGQLKKKFITE